MPAPLQPPPRRARPACVRGPRRAGGAARAWRRGEADRPREGASAGRPSLPPPPRLLPGQLWACGTGCVSARRPGCPESGLKGFHVPGATSRPRLQCSCYERSFSFDGLASKEGTFSCWDNCGCKSAAVGLSYYEVKSVYV